MGDFFASDELLPDCEWHWAGYALFANRIPAARLPSEDLKRLHGEYWGPLQSDPEMASALRDHQMLELANPDATSLWHATRNFSAISARYMS